MINVSPQVSVYSAASPMPEVSGLRLMLPQIPSTAFGDGSHPTTRLCAGAVDSLCRGNAIRSFLDVGTGTGILARIARARGVPFVVGTEINEESLSAARANMDLDALEAIELSSRLPDFWGPCFDLVVVNILEGPICALAKPIALALSPGGHLLLSGFTRRQVPAIGVHFKTFGLTVISESEMDGWALLRLKRCEGAELHS